jgi:nucleoside-diphosphate-sugar epimerase
MTILVTGAAGFIGARFLRTQTARPEIDEILATDQGASRVEHPKIRFLSGNIAYPQFTRSLVTPDVSAVFHFAALVSGGAEQNFELGTKVNLEATRDLLEACRLAGHRPKFVFASTIGVYGGDLPDPVTDDTPASPRISYGAQKLACEVLINDYTRRGFVDGRTLRLPAVLVREGTNTALSGWTSAIIREPLAGHDYVCPVRPDTRQPCISVQKVAEAFLHAADLPTAALGHDRTVLLNSVSVSAGQMWEAVRPKARGTVRFQPDPRVQSVMDAVPKATRSARATQLGFHHNSSIEEIIAESLA